MQGCHCPKGQIFNETTGICDPLKTCGCMFKGKKLIDGDNVKDNCNTWYVCSTLQILTMGVYIGQ